MIGRVLQFALPIAAGIAAGIGGSVFAAQRLAPAPVIRSIDTREAGGASEGALRIGASAAAAAAPVAAAAAPAVNAVPSRPARRREPPADVEQERARWHEKLIADHKADPIDRAWAAASRRTLEDDFASRAAERGYEVVDIDCRTTTCASVLQWKSYADALKVSQAAATDFYKLNCAREVYMPRPANEDVPYQATLMMDCKSLRE